MLVISSLTLKYFKQLARIIAIDYGNKRTGIAASDSLQLIASPLTVVPTGELIAFLKKYLSEETVETIVVGEPKHRNGELSGPIEALQNFVIFLKRSYPGISIVRADERYTSKLASQAMIEAGLSKKKRNDKTLSDALAATLILQGYMEQLDFQKARLNGDL
jgi:putative Holliday junction resolvase